MSIEENIAHAALKMRRMPHSDGSDPSFELEFAIPQAEPSQNEKRQKGAKQPCGRSDHAVSFWKFLAQGGLLLSCSGCASLSNGFLFSPAGPIARAEHHEFIVVGIILLFVLAPVALLLPIVAWHYRISNTHAAFRPQWAFSWPLEALIWIPPTGIVVVLAVLLWTNTNRLDPYGKLVTAGGPTLRVDVVALDWKWLFIYPAQNVATVNELVVPAGVPVQLYLTSGTVMQSLLMPRLAGQIFTMAGMQTQLNFEVAQPGTYLGENTQYNGDGFNQDKFVVDAVTPGDFTTWTKQTQRNPATLDDPAYQTLSRQSVIPQKLQFGKVEQGMFQRILAQQITPGYVAQHHEAGNG